ncbi:MAG TPA: IS21 family transposase, partial [Firmicutes bacterium]|nr:IS21 family transposase [Bacillota bacterium]
MLLWCEEERDKRAEAWEAERRGLRPVPAGIFRPCVSDVFRVSKLSLVTCQRNRYSVPNELIGSNVRLDLYNDRVEIWHREDLAAEHARLLGRNNSSLKIEHYLKAISRKPYAVAQAAVVRRLPSLYQQARELASRADPTGYREFVQILILHRDFEQEDILEMSRQAGARCGRRDQTGIAEQSGYRV